MPYFELGEILSSRTVGINVPANSTDLGFQMQLDNELELLRVNFIKADSAAAYAGLKNEDIILSVNDRELVKGAKFFKTNIDIIMNAFKRGLVTLEAIQVNVYKSLIKFKKCQIIIPPSWKNKGFGFGITSNSDPKYTIANIEFNSPAYQANLQVQDVIVQIDGTNIRQFKYEEILNRVQIGFSNKKLEILAISKYGYRFYKNQKYKFSDMRLPNSQNTEFYMNRF